MQLTVYANRPLDEIVEFITETISLNYEIRIDAWFLTQSSKIEDEKSAEHLRLIYPNCWVIFFSNYK